MLSADDYEGLSQKNLYILYKILYNPYRGAL